MSKASSRGNALFCLVFKGVKDYERKLGFYILGTERNTNFMYVDCIMEEANFKNTES